MATPKKEAAVDDLFAGLDVEFDEKPNTHYQTRAFSGARVTETPEEKARRVLTAALGEQLKLLDDPEYTVEKTRYRKGEGKVVAREAPKPIWVEAHDGVCHVTIRYGVRPVPIKPGMITARMPREQVKPFLEKFITLVNDGHYDGQLIALSKR